jgi:hypothetical protein
LPVDGHRGRGNRTGVESGVDDDYGKFIIIKVRVVSRLVRTSLELMTQIFVLHEQGAVSFRKKVDNENSFVYI